MAPLPAPERTDRPGLTGEPCWVDAELGACRCAHPRLKFTWSLAIVTGGQQKAVSLLSRRCSLVRV